MFLIILRLNMLNTFKLEERSLEYLLSQFHLITGCEALWAPVFSSNWSEKYWNFKNVDDIAHHFWHRNI